MSRSSSSSICASTLFVGESESMSVCVSWSRDRAFLERLEPGGHGARDNKETGMTDHLVVGAYGEALGLPCAFERFLDLRLGPAAGRAGLRPCGSSAGGSYVTDQHAAGAITRHACSSLFHGSSMS